MVTTPAPGGRGPSGAPVESNPTQQATKQATQQTSPSFFPRKKVSHPLLMILTCASSAAAGKVKLSLPTSQAHRRADCCSRKPGQGVRGLLFFFFSLLDATSPLVSALKRTLDLPSGGDPLASAAILGRPYIEPRTLCRSSSSTWLPVGDDDQKIFIFHNGKKVL